tara:strand:- start:76 stop:318 length:243 start_codon:yes stop_codon:yes gene_type:complete
MDEMELLKYMDQAMINSFNMIVENVSIEELMGNTIEEELVFMHDIENGHTIEVLIDLREYFSSCEDFEKCIELTKLIDKE